MTRPVGKTVGNRVYVHRDALSHLSIDLQQTIAQALSIAGQAPTEHANIIRLESDTPHVTLLHYPSFFDAPFPLLKESWRVDTSGSTVTYRTYEHSLNPPILHRKELLLHPDHPRVPEYHALTESAESLGLFDDTTRIGYHVQWNHLIRERGYEVVGHQLIPIGNDVSDAPLDDDTDEDRIYRHRTALVRYDLSAPMKSLARHGFLDGQYALFDYGCGRGDDIRGLINNGIEAQGWDPYFSPNNAIHRAPLVNLGFVINVIEDFDERIEALAHAYSLAETVLVVSVMIDNNNAVKGRFYNDGIVTQRGTFQKYYTQSEIGAFIEEVLDEKPVPIGPGLFYVFRDKEAEQRFLVDRYRTHRNLLQSSCFDPSYRPVTRQQRDDLLYEEHKSVLDALWSTTLTLGRKPDPVEVSELGAITEAFGTLNKAWRFICSRNSVETYREAQETRANDISVYLALRAFEQRKAYKHLDPGLKRDIKTFFGTSQSARDGASSLLFSISDPTAIYNACQYAVEHGLGYLDENLSLQLHTSLVERLPPILRVYCGCASALYGDYRNADLLKIHTQSGKLTLMTFDDFEGSPLPRMIERVKLKLREQDVEYYRYDSLDYPAPYLYFKSRYINEEYPHYPEQVDFDSKLAQLDFVDLSGYGPSANTLHEKLAKHRWEINGFHLGRSQSIPDLDAPCGKYFTFRDLIECGETQQRTGIANLPKEPDTYSALLDLAENILDPVVEYFGMIKLTYGFCSPELQKHIHTSIAPKLDQHSSHEKRRDGRLICDRRGAAVDFLVEDENMADVVNWIAENTAFDRIYFYGNALPIHVSWSSKPVHSVIYITLSRNGRLIPHTATMPIT